MSLMSQSLFKMRESTNDISSQYVDKYISKLIKEEWFYLVRNRYSEPHQIIDQFNQFVAHVKQFEGLKINEESRDVIENLVNFDFEYADYSSEISYIDTMKDLETLQVV